MLGISKCLFMCFTTSRSDLAVCLLESVYISRGRLQVAVRVPSTFADDSYFRQVNETIKMTIKIIVSIIRMRINI